MKNAVLQFANPQSVRHGGALADRLARQTARLESDMYLPPLVFESQSIDTWPGDWEGRALLAYCRLYSLTGKKIPAMERIMCQLEEKNNSCGYFGKELDMSAIDEQQLSGHGWFLRGKPVR